MNFLTNGKVMFADEFEMNYYLFLEIGLSLNNESRLYDNESGIVLRFQDKYIKSAVVPTTVYAGRDDIVFNINNYKLISRLLGYFLDKYSNDPDNNFQFIAQYNQYTNDDKQQLFIKCNKGLYVSSPYYNLSLAAIELIFTINENFNVDLSNFDAPLN